jgi:S-adenosylmethionine:tRNA ribosyltransferase-isomerase
MYSLSDFDFHLPEELIAQRPASPRDHARLLVYNRAQKSISGDLFYTLGIHLEPETTLVLNNSRVEKARILIGNIEVFVLRQLDTVHAEVLVRPGKKFRAGISFAPAEGVQINTLSVQEDGVRTIKVSPGFDDPIWDQWKLTPFPPYIKQDESLAEEYQTVYAKDEGSKAAPTAGLHFTDQLLKELKHSNFDIQELTLHVGLGTFAPVKVEHIDDHIMHSEWYSIHPDTAAALTHATHITAVGTTSARTLESIVSGGHTSKRQATTRSERSFDAGSGSTDIFIKPGYRFKAVDALITNFHLPKSTLLMMISALTGIDEMHRIYEHAIKEKYRFFSFGDAMIIR